MQEAARMSLLHARTRLSVRRVLSDRECFDKETWWRECCCHRNFSSSDGFGSSRWATIPYEMQISKPSWPTGARIGGPISSPLGSLSCRRDRPNGPNGVRNVLRWLRVELGVGRFADGAAKPARATGPPVERRARLRAARRRKQRAVAT